MAPLQVCVVHGTHGGCMNILLCFRVHEFAGPGSMSVAYSIPGLCPFDHGFFIACAGDRSTRRKDLQRQQRKDFARVAV
jgi:hypothetical protein